MSGGLFTFIFFVIIWAPFSALLLVPADLKRSFFAKIRHLLFGTPVVWVKRNNHTSLRVMKTDPFGEKTVDLDGYRTIVLRDYGKTSESNVIWKPYKEDEKGEPK